MNKECELIKDLLPLYVDGICSEESIEIVEKHIESCEGCKKELDYLRKSIEIPVETEEMHIKNFKKLFSKKVWLRVITIVLVLVILSFAANVYMMLHWEPIWPHADAEGIKEFVSVVQIDNNICLHQEDLFGFGEVVNLTNENDSKQGIYRFYLGEQGIHSLPPFSQMRGYMTREKYTVLTSCINESQNPVNKVIYCDPSGKEIVTLWDESQKLEEYGECDKDE